MCGGSRCVSVREVFEGMTGRGEACVGGRHVCGVKRVCGGKVWGKWV